MASPEEEQDRLPEGAALRSELCSYEDKCYICHGPETDTMPFIDPNPCACKGSIKIHNCCIFPLMTPETNICCICKSKYIIPDGPIKWFYDNGATRMEGTVKNDKYQGPKNWYYSDGSKRAEEFCINDKRHGLCKYYYEGGSAPSNKALGRETGSQTLCGKLRSTQIYELEKRVDLWKFYYDNGNLEATENYIDGLREGSTKHYYKHGNLLSHELYKNGKLNGLSKFYHECGLIHCEIYYENDVQVLRRDHFVKPGAKK